MSSSVLFSDRLDAGNQLAQAVNAEIERVRASGVTAAPIVYALPRGGLPVAVPVAHLLGCPLDIIVAKKITQPEDPELAIGAVTADGHVLWSPRKPLPPSHPSLQQALQQAQAKALAQLHQMAPSCPRLSPQGAIVILVDDGIATGMTMRVAVQALKAQNPAAVWIATPVAPRDLSKSLRQWSDRAIVLATPHPFFSVSRFYAEFPQVELEAALVYLRQGNSC